MKKKKPRTRAAAPPRKLWGGYAKLLALTALVGGLGLGAWALLARPAPSPNFVIASTTAVPPALRARPLVPPARPPMPDLPSTPPPRPPTSTAGQGVESVVRHPPPGLAAMKEPSRPADTGTPPNPFVTPPIRVDVTRGRPEGP